MAVQPHLSTRPDDFRHARVLIVDDDPLYRELLQRLTEKIGIGHIETAANGAEGLEKCFSTPPDLVLLDILMPGIDGYEFCRRLRQQEGFSNTAILIQTALEKESERVACFQAGASDVVSKPLSVIEFSARMRTHLLQTMQRKMLGDFQQRLQTHLQLARGLMADLLPNLSQAQKTLKQYHTSLDVFHAPHEEVGGDVWYVQEWPGHKALVLLMDAAAHGVAGAMGALRIDSWLREMLPRSTCPGKLLHQLDDRLSNTPGGTVFAGGTAILIDAQENNVTYAVAGNPAPLLVSAKQVTDMGTTSPPLGSGLVNDSTKCITWYDGDTIVFHSDGITIDAEKSGSRLMAQATARQLNAATCAAFDSTETDDSTLILLQRNTERSAS